MINFRYQSANYEIYLALAGAFGMMSLMLNTAMGKIIMGISLILLCLLYAVFSILPGDPNADNRFQVILNRINFIGAAAAAILLTIMLIFLPRNPGLAIPALGLLAVCLALNAANRYIYRISDQNHYYQQLRFLILAGLIVLVMLWGP